MLHCNISPQTSHVKAGQSELPPNEALKKKKKNGAADSIPKREAKELSVRIRYFQKHHAKA